MRRFEFVGGGSNKFWEISQSGTEVTVHFGRIGTNGQTQTKDYASWDDAAERVRKLVAEKLREGYMETARERADPEMAGFQRPPSLPRYEVPTLPGDGPLVIGDVELPAGRRLSGDPKWAPRGVEPVAQPVIWATDRPVADAGRLLHQLRTGAAAMNLVPMLLSGLESDPTRPWDRAEFSPTDPRRSYSFDAAAELAQWWRGNFEDEDDETVPSVQPFGINFPGVASSPPLTSRLVDDLNVLEQIKGRRLALIAAARPADAITAIGWMGAVNVHDDTAPMSAVLRSWEVRWLARVVEIGQDTLTLTVGNPPLDEKTSLALAAEHMAFCPDNVWQGSETITAYAKALQNSRIWEFWWD